MIPIDFEVRYSKVKVKPLFSAHCVVRSISFDPFTWSIPNLVQGLPSMSRWSLLILRSHVQMSRSNHSFEPSVLSTIYLNPFVTCFVQVLLLQRRLTWILHHGGHRCFWNISCYLFERYMYTCKLLTGTILCFGLVNIFFILSMKESDNKRRSFSTFTSNEYSQIVVLSINKNLSQRQRGNNITTNSYLSRFKDSYYSNNSVWYVDILLICKFERWSRQTISMKPIRTLWEN